MHTSISSAISLFKPLSFSDCHSIKSSFLFPSLLYKVYWIAFQLGLSKPIEQIADLYGKEHSHACSPALLFQNHWHIKYRALTSRSTRKYGPWDTYYGFLPKPQDKHDSKKYPSFPPNFPTDSCLTAKRSFKATLCRGKKAGHEAVEAAQC